jgi:hypothetical protein
MVSGGILFIREPIPKIKISILEKYTGHFQKENGKIFTWTRLNYF